jgi:hypothetical protein
LAGYFDAPQQRGGGLMSGADSGSERLCGAAKRLAALVGSRSVELVEKPEAARRLGVSVARLNWLAGSGQITPIWVGPVEMVSLEAIRRFA